MASISETCRATGFQQCHICEDTECGDNTNPTKPIVGYKLTRPNRGGGWLFAGKTPEEVATAIRNEVEMNEGLPADECGQIILSACTMTQAEIDALPEFGGW